MIRSRLARAVPALLVVLGLAAASACTSPPADFYMPAPGVAGTPGTVLKTANTSLSGVGDIKAVAIQYRSRSATNQPIAVTGSVYVPNAPWTGSGARPIVSVAQGTQGLGDSCAPSKSLVTGLNYELPYVQALLARGWAVAVTDYEGLGMPGTHTYIAADAEAHAQIDIVRAATKVSPRWASTPTRRWRSPATRRVARRPPGRPRSSRPTPPSSTWSAWPPAACRPTPSSSARR